MPPPPARGLPSAAAGGEAGGNRPVPRHCSGGAAPGARGPAQAELSPRRRRRAPLPSGSPVGTRELLNPRRSPTRASGAESGGAPSAGRPPAPPPRTAGARGRWGARSGRPRPGSAVVPPPAPDAEARRDAARPPAHPRPARPHPAAGPRSPRPRCGDAPRRPALPRRRGHLARLPPPPSRGALRPLAGPGPGPDPGLSCHSPPADPPHLGLRLPAPRS